MKITALDLASRRKTPDGVAGYEVLGETLVFVGQDLSRDVARGFPWHEFDVRESASSGRFFGLKRRGEPFRPSLTRPPLSPDQFRQLGLGAAGRWRRLQIPFDDVRQMI